MKLFVLSQSEENERVRRDCKDYKDCENAVSEAQEFGETKIRVCVAFIWEGDFVPDFFKRMTVDGLGAKFARYDIPD